MSRIGLFLVAKWRTIRAKFYTKKSKKKRWSAVCCRVQTSACCVKHVFISVSCRFPQRNVCRQLASAHQNPLQFRQLFCRRRRRSSLAAHHGPCSCWLRASLLACVPSSLFFGLCWCSRSSCSSWGDLLALPFRVETLWCTQKWANVWYPYLLRWFLRELHFERRRKMCSKSSSSLGPVLWAAWEPP